MVCGPRSTEQRFLRGGGEGREGAEKKGGRGVASRGAENDEKHRNPVEATGCPKTGV